MFDTVPAGNEGNQFNLSKHIFIWGWLIAHNWPEHGSHSVDAGFRYNHRAPAPKTESSLILIKIYMTRSLGLETVINKLSIALKGKI